MKKYLISVTAFIFVSAFWLGICHNAGIEPKSGDWKVVCIDLLVGQNHK